MTEIEVTDATDREDAPITVEVIRILFDRAMHECARVGVALDMGQPDVAIDIISLGAWEALLAFSTARETYHQQLERVN